MKRRKLYPRFSLRTLLVIMLFFSLATQAAVTAKHRRLQKRRDILIPDLHAQVVASQRMNAAFAQRFLKIVQQKITLEEEYLSDSEERELQQLIAVELTRRHLDFQAHD